MQWVSELAVSRWVIFALIIGVYIFLGTFMDQVAIQVLTLPITFPIIVSLGFDPIWFGVIIVKTTEIGLITPPLGLNVYILKGVTGEKAGDGLRRDHALFAGRPDHPHSPDPAAADRPLPARQDVGGGKARADERPRSGFITFTLLPGGQR